jgi:hypothetical protein
VKKDSKILINSEAVDSAFSELEEYNSYYENVSVIFRIISFVIFAALLIFTVSSAFVSADEFSYKNLEFIMRNFALTLEENKDSVRQPIRYNPDSVNQFATFGEGLAVCGSNSLSVFSATGRQTCSESFAYREPVLRASKKFILIYDEGTGNYSVYNSFSRVHSDEIDKPIKNAVLSDNGYYALITSSDMYNSTVEIYNPDCSLINRYNKNGYVSCVDVNNDSVAIITSEASFGSATFSIEILISAVDNPESAKTARFDSGYPLGCKIVTEGVFVVCTDSVYFFDKDGNVISSYSFDGRLLSDFSIGDTGVCLLFNSRGLGISYNLLFIDTLGAEAYRAEINETVFDIDIFNNVSFVLTEDTVRRISASSQSVCDVTPANYGCQINAFGENTAYYCSDSYATVLTLPSD